MGFAARRHRSLLMEVMHVFLLSCFSCHFPALSTLLSSPARDASLPSMQGVLIAGGSGPVVPLGKRTQSHIYMAPCSFAWAVQALYVCFHTSAEQAVHRLTAIYLAVENASLADLVHKALIMHPCAGKCQTSFMLSNINPAKFYAQHGCQYLRWGLLKEYSFSKFLFLKTSSIILI